MTVPYKTRWEQIFELDLYQDVWCFYNNQNFPIRVRASLVPQWLEFHVDELQLRANPDNPDDHTYFEHFMSLFLQEFQNVAENVLQIAYEKNDIQGRAIGYEIQAEAAELNTRFQNNPAALFKTILECMNCEKHLISQKLGQLQNPTQQGVVSEQTTVIGRYTILNRRLSQVSRRGIPDSHVSYINGIREKMGQTIADLSQARINFNSLTDIQNISLAQDRNGCVNEELPTLRTFRDISQAQIIENLEKLKGEVKTFTTYIKTSIDILKALLNEVVQLIDEWKDEQRRAANGFPTTHNLDQISTLANLIAVGIIELYNQLQCKSRIESCLADNGESIEAVVQAFRGLKAELENLLCALVPKTFVVEKQPPQILSLKTTMKQSQSVAVQLLVGSTLIPTSSLSVEAILIDKEEAKKLHANVLYQPKAAMPLTTNKAEMSNNPQNKFRAEFKGITLPENRNPSGTQKVKAKGQKDGNDDYVPRTKYVFYIKTVFPATYDMPSFTIWTETLPVIVTCHPNQYADAWGTILWDNAFPHYENDKSKTRVPFEVKDEVSPSDLIEVISQVFKLQTRRGLSESHKNFLHKKIMGNRSGPVTWKMFADDPIVCSFTKSAKKDVKVTFNSWLYTIKKMCEPCVKETKTGQTVSKDNTSIPPSWEGKLIEGFITREQLHEKLQNSPRGTFILYFSEMILGGITVAWFNHQEGTVNKFAPYEVQELKDNPLQERILNADHLLFLYPNIPKEGAFKRLRDSKELTELEFKLLQDGYILHNQKQVTTEISNKRFRQVSNSSSASQYATSP